MKSNTRIDRRLLAELVKDADPKRLFDPDGLLASLSGGLGLQDRRKTTHPISRESVF